MNSLAVILASFGLVFPVASAPFHPDALEDQRVRLTEEAALTSLSQGRAIRLLPAAYLPFLAPQQPPVFEQVRIERRVTVRIAPRPGPVRENLVTSLAPRGSQPRYLERPIGDCLPVQSIAGVHAEGSNRLLLFLRDRRLISATLEKACSARDFYSGFYMENSRDGQLCVDRDQLHARSGAKCEVARLSQLVRVIE
ncbi:hypothetical protein A9995_07830 [Erythrobacter sp. QSSC1-22B]|uniref:hypothetical protein n=1 Tax=Erythrobacter sp. QSSC1-22B TaxID=1860125 RepID=UPI000805284A|nr:hypothetical protein [Erythrobacter sp. QSSC1-22B]OBX19052.1 hypothetical protein A9995_07830 [Erythrobacter sp. QSSC1-22B]